ncbi:legume-like lectin family-domain-containing protein [Radiomyces spectabilis]|uniref:legume-like lectin family-domain-containing protein n=1 Tax=Radiomyces spectabilis TaxID=64574 RepID=UPI00221E4A4A|nr:legume-like lectin family-domain-containing protein [Radiomyces spectabilis]KAI8366803.1 legume-like lectin family-domain-containing protein [Radiomyces spectabilis]
MTVRYLVLPLLLTLITTVLAQVGRANGGAVVLRTHSIAMPYIDDDLQNRWFDFGGDAVINTNRHVRLTSLQQSQSGYLWSRLPLTADNFEVEFEFKVDGPSGHLYGDGFAVWLSKQRTMQGPVFGSVDKFDGLGIFFDTYDNERAHRHSFPYISSMLGNGMQPYDNGKDGRDTELAGCEADFRGKQFPTKGRLTYYKNNYLELQVQWRAEEEWDTCFKVPQVNLPDQIYLGFTAHTGEVVDEHDIISVTTKKLSPKPIEMPATKESQPKSKSRGGGFFSFLFKLILAAGLVGVLFVGYRAYESNNRNKRF